MKIFTTLFLYFVVNNCDSYKILGIFPHSARSHHIYFTALVEELARRQHDVTVINYHPMRNLSTLHQIPLKNEKNTPVNVDIEKRLELMHISDILMAYTTAKKYKMIANTSCNKLLNNLEVRKMIGSTYHYDLVIIEHFVSDCGFAIAYKLNAPVIGITAHILKPWTYSRLGAPNNAAFVPNHFFGSGIKPNLLNKIKSVIINFGMSMYYEYVIQKSDQDIVHEVYPDTPLLKDLGKNMSLILLNQYFPLTGPRLHSCNVVEVGGLHVTENNLIPDQGLRNFLDSTNKSVIYIGFGSLASNLPRKLSNEIIKLLKNSNMAFVWKTDVSNWVPPSNVFIGKWMPQVAVLCHPKVIGFISHSGMLSTTEAIHCGVPIISVPLFGDQFANAQAAVERGIGVAVDVLTVTERVLEIALETILQEKYQKKAKELSQIWKDRPMSAMDTAIFWIEYVARNKGAVNMKPPTIDLSFYEYYMIDVLLVLGSSILLIVFTVKGTFLLIRTLLLNNAKQKHEKMNMGILLFFLIRLRMFQSSGIIF